MKTSQESFRETWAKLPVEKKEKIEAMKKEDVEELRVMKGNVKGVKINTGLGWRAKRKLKSKPESSYLVKMIFSNGTTRYWVVETDDELFVYKKRMYYLRKENSFYNLTHHQQELIYYDDYVCPIEKNVVLMEDEEEKDSNLRKAFFSIVPSNLKPLIKMEYVKALAESSEFSKYLKLSLIFGLLNFALLVYLGYTAYKHWGAM